MAQLAAASSLVLAVGCTTESAQGGAGPFTPGSAPQASASGPTASLGPGVPQVTQGDFVARFRLEGQSEASRTVRISWPPFMSAADVTRAGTAQKGKPLGTLTLASKGKMSRLFAAQWEGKMLAPASGTFVATDRRVDIESIGLDFVASLTPVQALRLRGQRFAGTVQIETSLGESVVPCDAVWLTGLIESPSEESPPASPRQNATDSEIVDPPTLAVRCRLPQNIDTMPGIRGTLTLTSPTIRNALIVPAAAVQFDPKTTEYFVKVDSNGSSRNVTVTTGPTNGAQRLVEGELTPGQVLLVEP